MSTLQSVQEDSLSTDVEAGKREGSAFKSHYLSSEEKDGRIRQLHQQHRGLAVDSELHCEFRDTMSQNADTMSQQLPEGSFSRIFWENQLRAAQLKDATSMHWDPIMIRWCLYLRHLSGRAYDMMREAVVNLPSR